MVPFIDAEEAWFWFVDSEKAKADGAKPIAGMTDTPRPCSPCDIYVAITKTHRLGRLNTMHMLTLREFGRRGYRPDKTLHKGYRDEREAARLWDEAMEELEFVLKSKGIVENNNVIKLRRKI